MSVVGFSSHVLLCQSGELKSELGHAPVGVLSISRCPRQRSSWHIEHVRGHDYYAEASYLGRAKSAADRPWNINTALTSAPHGPLKADYFA